jgi:uncharacterized protein YoxC
MNYVLFLIPNDIIQVIFFVIIAGLSVGTALWVRKTACPENWLKKWQNNTFDKKEDDLNAAHGSIYDLSEAVAMPSEKFADALPSMLLVIGLLGTFLGVGFSLDAASGILKSGAQEDASKLLEQMLPMLNGMGALFKSSIYGIIFFFLFTLWKSKFGTSAKRLSWCATECNKEENNPVLKALNGLSKTLGKNLRDSLVASLEQMNVTLENMNKSLGESLKECVSEGFKETGKDLKSSANELKKLSTSMLDGFMTVKSSAEEMGKASKSLATSVENFTPAVTAALDSIQNKFVKSINASGQIMEKAGVNIREGVDEMSREINASQVKLKETLDTFDKKMGKILVQIDLSCESAQNLASATTSKMTDLQNAIENRLQSIASSNLKVNDSIKGLPQAIQKLNDSMDTLPSSLAKLNTLLESSEEGSSSEG